MKNTGSSRSDKGKCTCTCLSFQVYQTEQFVSDRSFVILAIQLSRTASAYACGCPRVRPIIASLWERWCTQWHVVLCVFWSFVPSDDALPPLSPFPFASVVTCTLFRTSERRLYLVIGFHPCAMTNFVCRFSTCPLDWWYGKSVYEGWVTGEIWSFASKNATACEYTCVSEMGWDSVKICSVHPNYR